MGNNKMKTLLKANSVQITGKIHRDYNSKSLVSQFSPYVNGYILKMCQNL